MRTPVMKVVVTAPRPTTSTPSLPSAGLTVVLLIKSDLLYFFVISIFRVLGNKLHYEMKFVAKVSIY
jgi:hypothetical protein